MFPTHRRDACAPTKAGQASRLTLAGTGIFNETEKEVNFNARATRSSGRRDACPTLAVRSAALPPKVNPGVAAFEIALEKGRLSLTLAA